MSGQALDFKVKKKSLGIGDVSGFLNSGVSCDIRNKGDQRLDLSLIYSTEPCEVAGVFTINRFAAAPVEVCQKVLAGGNTVRAIVANSGNANACTGKQGDTDAKAMQKYTAKQLGLKSAEVLIASTGRIGELLPMDKLSEGIELASASLSQTQEQSYACADAILTSDTRRKTCTVEIPTSKGTITLSGIGKGAGMIEPNMATMLAFYATDAKISSSLLNKCLEDAVAGSFNAITVDGDMSTNDTVLLLANGASGVEIKASDKKLLNCFKQALRYVCYDLATKIVGDGEKITKVVEIQIDGAKSKADAEDAARAIGNSLLVKSSWYGEDPNWGRLLDALGYSKAKYKPRKVSLYYQGSDKQKPIPVFIDGEVQAGLKSKWKQVVSRKSFRILIDLAAGKQGFQLLASDLTEGYVNFNKSE